MKLFTSLLICLLFINCNKKNSTENDKNVNHDTIERVSEKDLLYLKNLLFINYLNSLEKESNESYTITKNDSCYIRNHIQDVSGHQYIQMSTFSVKYVDFDNSSKKLLLKWLKKNDFDLIPIEDGEKIKHSFNYYKALEFYNSIDLKNYIDSVRIIERNKHHRNSKT